MIRLVVCYWCMFVLCMKEVPKKKKYTPEEMAALGMTMDICENEKYANLGARPKTKPVSNVKFWCVCFGF